MGNPSQWNDKTLKLFDELAKVLRDGTTLEDVEFELKETDQARNVIAVK
jgi:hypothetical protein